MNSKTYEGLFLLDPGQATQDWEGTKKQVLDMLERRGGQIVSAKKWGERKLAYEIQGHKRGVYLLVYFQMPSESITTVRRDFQLSETVLRNMILLCKKKMQKNIQNEEEEASSDENVDGAESENTESDAAAEVSESADSAES